MRKYGETFDNFYLFAFLVFKSLKTPFNFGANMYLVVIED